MLREFVALLFAHDVPAYIALSVAHLLNEARFVPPLPDEEVDKIADEVADDELQGRRSRRAA